MTNKHAVKVVNIKNSYPKMSFPSPSVQVKRTESDLPAVPTTQMLPITMTTNKANQTQSNSNNNIRLLH